jgi:hypothetical protein
MHVPWVQVNVRLTLGPMEMPLIDGSPSVIEAAFPVVIGTNESYESNIPSKIRKLDLFWIYFGVALVRMSTHTDRSFSKK